MFLSLLHNSSIQKEMDRQTVHLSKIIVQVFWHSGHSGTDKCCSSCHLWSYRAPSLVSHTLQRYWATAADSRQRPFPARRPTTFSFFSSCISYLLHYRNFHGQLFCPSCKIASKKTWPFLGRFRHVLSLAGITPSAAYFLPLPVPPESAAILIISIASQPGKFHALGIIPRSAKCFAVRT